MEPKNLTQEAKEILVKALESDKGNIKIIGVNGIHSILIDGKKLGDSTNNKHSKAFNKLIKSRLIEKKQIEGNSYQLTEDGRRIAEDIQ